MLYFYALTSHCGQWIRDAYSRARHWQVSAQLLYGQVKKHYRRRRVERLEHRAILGSLVQIRAALTFLGFSGTIQTALKVVDGVVEVVSEGQWKRLAHE